MYSKIQLSKLIHKVTRLGYTNILTRHYHGAISNYKLLQNDDRKTQNEQRAPTAFHRMSKINFIPVRLQSDSQNPVTVEAIIKDLKSVSKAPLPALVLGFGGLIPFVSAPLSMICTGTFALSLVQSQIVYGACILSFIGGVCWGVTLPDNRPISPNMRNLGYSVIPSLVACLALFFSPPKGLLILVVGLVGTAIWDKKLNGYPAWFLGMRYILTFVACLSLLSSYVLVKSSGRRSNLKSAVIETNN